MVTIGFLAEREIWWPLAADGSAYLPFQRRPRQPVFREKGSALAGFTLDPRLAASTLDIGALQLCRVLRANDQNFPWLILVPMRDGARDVIDLPEAELALMWREVGAALRVLKDQTKAHKLNVAALGNAVPQLHVHLIARLTSDVAWPRPIWDVAPPKPFGADEAATEMRRWKLALGCA